MTGKPDGGQFGHPGREDGGGTASAAETDGKGIARERFRVAPPV